MIAWLKANKILIAVLSLVGSIAGVGFSAVDLRDSLNERAKKKNKTA